MRRRSFKKKSQKNGGGSFGGYGNGVNSFAIFFKKFTGFSLIFLRIRIFIYKRYDGYTEFKYVESGYQRHQQYARPHWCCTPWNINVKNRTEARSRIILPTFFIGIRVFSDSVERSSQESASHYVVSGNVICRVRFMGKSLHLGSILALTRRLTENSIKVHYALLMLYIGGNCIFDVVFKQRYSGFLS